jgi:DNA-binding FrmR family transcriptional regulator
MPKRQVSVASAHPDVVLRLKRAEGHLRSTIAMVEAGRSCLELAQQLHAIERAVVNAKKALIHDHIDHCLEAQLISDPAAAKRAVAETKKLSKYL